MKEACTQVFKLNKNSKILKNVSRSLASLNVMRLLKNVKRTIRNVKHFNTGAKIMIFKKIF